MSLLWLRFWGPPWVQELTGVCFPCSWEYTHYFVSKTPALFGKGSEQVNCRHETVVWGE